MADEAHEQIHVDADPLDCFDLATDFEAYPTWAKDVKEATVLARDDAGRPTRVQYRAAALGRTIRYVLDYDFADAPAAFSWRLVEGDMVKAIDGRYGFAAEGAGTDVTYDLRVDLTVPMPGILKRKAAGMITGAALADLKRVAEAGVP
ncbi:MAG TPA: SRPBCC family protein [Acidimicrobiia bacterium]|nr:SRPBCC family protein [Acidimicrobiia bacterium]